MLSVISKICLEHNLREGFKMHYRIQGFWNNKCEFSESFFRDKKNAELEFEQLKHAFEKMQLERFDGASWYLEKKYNKEI